MKTKLEQNLAGPELITSCKETQLTRLQCRVEQLATQPRRHSLKIINLCESHDGDDDNIDEMTQSGDIDRHSGDERGAQSTIDMFRVVSFLRCLNFDSKLNDKYFAKFWAKCRVEYQMKDKIEFRLLFSPGPCWCQQIEFSSRNFALLSKLEYFERISVFLSA